MTALLSSPMGPPMRFDIFQQPSSPTLRHSDLPAEFGDQSFGSSMSLGSSFELASQPSRDGGLLASSSSNDLLSSVQQQHFDQLAGTGSPQRRSPPRQGLGAAMGTALSEKSPNLAAKLSSPHYMDISPAPAQRQTPSVAGPSQPRTVSRPSSLTATRRQSDELLPPGSAMKEDIPTPRVEARRSADTSSASNAGGSLGRLFGTALSREVASQDNLADASFDSPDRERPLKRRPSSLPLGGSQPHSRPSMRSAGLMPGPSSGRRPTSLKVGPSQSASGGGSLASRRQSSNEALRRQSSSDRLGSSSSSLGRPGRMRAASADSTYSDRCGVIGSSSLEGETPHSRSSLPPCPPTIIESPSPSQYEGLGSYFFDPQSPDHVGDTGIASSSSPIASPLGAKAIIARRPLEKATTMSTAMLPSFGNALAEAGKSSSLGKRSFSTRRPGLAALQPNNGGGQATALKTAYPVLEGGTEHRLTAPAPRRCHSATNNAAAFRRPDMMAAAPRMMMSVREDAMCSPGETDRRFPEGFDSTGSPVAPSSRPSLLRRTSKDDSSPLGYGARRNQQGGETASPSGGGSRLGKAGERSPMVMGSPYASEGLPGFGCSEKEGKVLPCFSVKNDGLMRITPQTLVDLMSGRFDERIKGYHVVDCRFGYEYEGGHVPSAINLSTVEKVKAHFLTPGEGLHANQPLPPRTQSGKPDPSGSPLKTVLVFHCEFSAKRAPSMALALRQADRALAHDWPSCHFPELYVLEGGYCAFFKAFPQVCEPQRYVPMDDPKFLDKRTSELGRFRAQFNRNRSFTYGESRANLPGSFGQGLGNAAGKSGGSNAIREEESSMEESPSAAVAGANRKKLGAGTSELGAGAAASRQARPGLAQRPLLAATARLKSFGAAAVGDESTSSCEDSFERSGGDSPCGAAAARKPVSSVLVPGPQQQRPGPQGLVRHSLQRAQTASTVLR